MSTDPATSLPQKFVDNTVALCGQSGLEWLDALPEIIAALEREWAVELTGHFRDLSYNYVANAATPDGKSVVVKIALPLADPEIFGEAAFLEAANGSGAVKCLRFDRERRAMLLERVAPGANLRSVFKRDQHAAVAVAIKMLKRLLLPVPHETAGLVSLDSWFRGLERHVETVFPAELATRALSYYAELSRDTANIHFIHGDLHHDNILSAKREPFLAIDPKGMIGHLGYDIGVFLNNHRDWLEWDTRLEGKLDRAVAEFAEAFELEDEVVRKWAFCQMVLSWWWLFDEMPGMFTEELGIPEVWKV